MIFTKEQIKDMLAILKRWQLILIGEHVGVSFLTEEEKALLLASGIDVNKFKNRRGVVEEAYLFGLLAEAIEDERAKDMDYDEFRRFLDSGNFVPLSQEEEYRLDFVKQRAYTDITNLVGRMQNKLSQIALQNNQTQEEVAIDMIRGKAIKAVQFRQTAQQFASELGHAAEQWDTDWLRVSTYILQSAYNHGKASTIMSEYGEDAEVCFHVMKNACKHCFRLYHTDPEDPYSEPKRFKISELLANGSNIGRKPADYLPSLDPVHPYCRCSVYIVKKNDVWNPETRMFDRVYKTESDHPKLKGVKLNIKVTRG